MKAFSEGGAIFAAALRSLTQRPRAALGLFAVAWAGFTVTDLISSYRVMIEGDESGGLAQIGLDAMLLAILAVGWHRAVLCPGEPGLSLKRWAHYALAWFINGMLIFVLLIPVWIAILVVVFFAAEIIAYGGVLPGDLMDGMLDTRLPLLFHPWAFAAVMALGGPAFLYCLFRMALGLPRIAIDQGDLRFMTSWRRSAPLARPIAGLAILAGLAQVVPLNLPYAWDWYAQPIITGLASLVPMALVASLLYAATVLVGAAILTELYRRTET